MWEEIKELATNMTDRWSNATKLGIAARYIVRHYPKLTAYLGNPIISISDEFSERMTLPPSRTLASTPSQSNEGFPVGMELRAQWINVQSQRPIGRDCVSQPSCR
jgi:hypothetical protein